MRSGRLEGNDVWDLDCLLRDDSGVVVGAVVVVVGRVVVDADVFLVTLACWVVVVVVVVVVVLLVARFQAGEGRLIEAVVEPCAQGVFCVELVANVARLNPRVGGVGVVVVVRVGAGPVDAKAGKRATSSRSVPCSEE